MKFTSKQIALIALLGAINGVLEITLGTYLHIFSFYFTGNIMIGLNCIVYILGRKAIPQRGTILLIGTITAFLKFFFGLNINAVSAIFMEAVMMEFFIFLIGFNVAGVITGAVFANIWALFHKLITLSIIGGEGFLLALNNIIKKGASLLNIGDSYILTPLIFLVVLYSLWGIIFGILGWKITNKLYPKVCSSK